jgi:hypothetical protein
MGHNRKIVIGATALTKARNNRHEIVVGTEVMDELEPIIVDTGFLRDAPFEWISLVFRYGLKNDEAPTYEHIDERYHDLPLVMELDTRELQHASKDELKRIFMRAALKTLVHVGGRYHLPTTRIEEMLAHWQ